MKRETRVFKAASHKKPLVAEAFTAGIKRKYLLALFIIGALVLFSFAGLLKMMSDYRTNAAVINVSGRQRMLSQRIAKLAHDIIHEKRNKTERAKHRMDLLDTISLMEKSHQALLRGDKALNLPGNPPPAVKSMYFEPPLLVDKHIREFISAGRGLAGEPDDRLTFDNPHMLVIERLSSTVLLDALDKIVAQHQEDSEMEMRRVHNVAAVILALILSTLVLVGVFIFRPLARRIRDEADLLARSEKKIRDITASLGEGVIVTDTSGRLTFMNPEAERLLGWTEAELMGKNVHAMIHHKKIDGSPFPFKQCAIPQSVSTGRITRSPEEVFTRKDGSDIPVSVVVAPIVEDGEATGAAMAFHDITDRKQWERRVRNQAERIALLSEVTVLANEADTTDEALLSCMEKVCAQTGWEIGHIYVYDAGEDLLVPTALWWPGAPASRFARFREVTQSTTFASGEGIPGRVMASGQPAWIMDISADTNFPRFKAAVDDGLKACFAFPIKEGNRVAVVLEFFTTQTRRIDPALMDTVKSIATQLGRVTERNRAQEELRIAKERAEKATRLKDQFVSLVAHDLRSPFNTILGFLHILGSDRQTPLTEKQKDLVNRASRTGENLVGMIDKLLDLQRLQTGEMTLNKRLVNARIIVGHAVESLAPSALEKGIKISNDIPEDMEVDADPDLLVEVIRNLVSNSIKFCQSGACITLFAPSGQPSAIAVKDTGPGLKKEIIENVFNHETATSTLGTAGEEGTGLGLPLSHDIMIAHGGSLEVESVEGGGSVFRMQFPEK